MLAEVMRCVWALAEVMPSEVCVGTRRGHAIGGVCEDSLRSEVCAGTSRGHAIGCVCVHSPRKVCCLLEAHSCSIGGCFWGKWAAWVASAGWGPWRCAWPPRRSNMGSRRWH